MKTTSPRRSFLPNSPACHSSRANSGHVLPPFLPRLRARPRAAAHLRLLRGKSPQFLSSRNLSLLVIDFSITATLAHRHAARHPARPHRSQRRQRRRPDRRHRARCSSPITPGPRRWRCSPAWPSRSCSGGRWARSSCASASRRSSSRSAACSFSRGSSGS